MIFCSGVLWFVFYSFVGWVFEIVYCALLARQLVNRGFLYGPYCPVYGAGALANLLILGTVSNPFAIFFLSALICGGIEYATAWALDKLFHAKWWDYSNMRFNLQGRVCPQGLILFGVMAVLQLKFFHPWLAAATSHIPETTLFFLTGFLCAVLLIDVVATIARLWDLGQKATVLEAKANAAFQRALQKNALLDKTASLAQRVTKGNNPIPEKPDHSDG